MESEKNTENISASDQVNIDVAPLDKPATTDKKSFWIELIHNPKKRLILIIVLGVILIAIFGTGLYFLLYEKTSKTSDTESRSEAEKAAVTEQYQSVLDGVMTDSESANKHPLAVIVENHPDARPQSGLNKASIVYEAIAEGGITRFLALFGTNEAEKVGPVRSARTFFADYAHGYNAFLAHVGGSIDGLDKIKSDKIFDLDYSAYPVPFWREYKQGLATEHTMYASTIKLREQASKNQYSSANNFSVYKFKDDPKDAEKEALPESQKVSVDFSNSDFLVTFTYDKENNMYKRSLAGKAHNDAVTKDQLQSKNIILMTVNNKIITNRYNKQVSSMTTTGTGKAKIFMDGKMVEGTWRKDTAADREIFSDADGKEIVFNRGQFWICVVEPGTKITVE